jgi:uncharacterized repeat protein (TIGR01451 family)
MRAQNRGLAVKVWRKFCHILMMLAMMLAPLSPAHADLRVPAWYDSNAVITAPDWHYRVPISIPAVATVNSTIKLDVDFNALLAQMGVIGTFNTNSWRIVRSTGALATNAEFTDTIYAGATDATGNARGEVRFLLQDAGPVTYYLYFDITQNGTKPANTQTRINGNFESDALATVNPSGWIAPTKANPAFQALVTGGTTVSVTANSGTPTPVTATTAPRTGTASYLIGSRDANEPSTSNPSVTLTRTIDVPATGAGNLSLNYRVHGWDSAAFGSVNYDYITVQIVGTSTATLVGPTTATNLYATLPFSPNVNATARSATASGYGPYNGWDANTAGGRGLGMSLAVGSEPWFTVNAPLAAFAGQTVTLRITTRSSSTYKTWYHIDDVEWSVVTATLGVPEAFGVNITLPVAGSTIAAGTMLSIRAEVDAIASAAVSPVTVNIYSNAGTLVASSIRLYDNGTHGDATANDGVYSNNGSVPADPTYTIPSGAATSSNWVIRVFAKDASTPGLAQIPGAGAAQVQANFYNIDEIFFNVSGAAPPVFTVVKSAQTINDPVNGGSNPKSVPGAEVLYIIRVTNTGTGTTDSGSVHISDPVPANTELFVNSLGAGCGPVIYTQGTPSSTLTCNPATIDYSNNGGSTWIYSPVPDVFGYDPVVTNLRVRLSGAFAPNVGTAPYFELRFRVKIK